MQFFCKLTNSPVCLFALQWIHTVSTALWPHNPHEPLNIHLELFLHLYQELWPPPVPIFYLYNCIKHGPFMNKIPKISQPKLLLSNSWAISLTMSLTLPCSRCSFKPLQRKRANQFFESKVKKITLNFHGGKLFCFTVAKNYMSTTGTDT